MFSGKKTIHEETRNDSKRNVRWFVVCLAISLQVFLGAIAKADDGYRLWLRYDSLPARSINTYRRLVTSVVVTGNSATLDAIRSELATGCSGLLGSPVN